MRNILKQLKKRIRNYLERMAQVNRKYYGTGKLNCCDLNKKKSNNSTQQADP